MKHVRDVEHGKEVALKVGEYYVRIEETGDACVIEGMVRSDSCVAEAAAWLMCAKIQRADFPVTCLVRRWTGTEWRSIVELVPKAATISKCDREHIVGEF